VVVGDPLCAPFRTHVIASDDLDAPVDDVSGLPGFLSARRVSSLIASGVAKEAAALIARAELHATLGDADGARAALERATAIDPSFVQAQLTLASFYEAAGLWDAAIGRYERVLERKSDDATALNNLAYALATRKNDPNGALPYAKRAYQAPNATGAATDTFAWVQHLLGNDADALPLIAKAAKQLPDVAEVHLHAAAILAGTGNHAAARDELEKALKLDASLGSAPSVAGLRRILNMPSE
jgi:tetratricopeptide (TPR) repeat protein